MKLAKFGVLDVVVKFGVAPHLEQEEDACEKTHERDGTQSEGNLLPHLVL